MIKGVIFNVQRYSLQDGPGIRSTVFLKGCPLRCWWCSNPESQNAYPEVAHKDFLCNKCGRCVEVCDLKAISVDDKGIKINRKVCTNCGKCVEVCGTGALHFFGKDMLVEEVLQEVTRDCLFYQNSGGGVTASGGEPLSQSEFVAFLFERCQQAGIHTTLDTCGYAKADGLERILKHTDLVLYDLKHMDAAIHSRFTGVSNQLILDNVRLSVAKGVPVIIRIPLIPGINDSEEDIKAIVSFVVSLNHVTEIDLLPYHRFGMNKYKMLDRRYRLRGLPSQPDEPIQRLKGIIESFGLSCEIGG